MSVTPNPNVSQGHLAEVATALEKDVFRRILLANHTVFLIGAGRSSDSTFRADVRDELQERPGIHGVFDVYYPEELFEELLWGGKQGRNLLDLEELLAKSVHSVVILLESPGAIAELGAFANHKQLQDHLVVVVEKRFRKDRSFIALGPVKYLKEDTKSQIIYHDPRNPDTKKLGSEIRTAVRRQRSEGQIDSTVNNPIAAQHYLRAAIHVLDPVRFDDLQFLIAHVTDEDTTDSEPLMHTALSILRREREVVLRGEHYSLTTRGRDRLQRLFKAEKSGREIAAALDRARVNVLSWRLRRPQRLTA